MFQEKLKMVFKIHTSYDRRNRVKRKLKVGKKLELQ